MSRNDFPPEEFAHRRATVAAAMASRGLSWFLVFHPASIHWLTGSQTKGYQAFQCLLIDVVSARLVMFTREAERHEYQDHALVDELACWGLPGASDPIETFLELARSLGVFQGRTLGMEVPAYYLHPHHYMRIKAAFGSFLILNEYPNLIHDERLIKSTNEIACIREAARIADQCMMAAKQCLAEDRSELDLAGAIYRAALENGADVPAVPINLVSGPRAAYSHGAPTSRRLSAGDTGNVEFCIPFKGHTVSIGRQFSIGPPSARVQKLHAIVREAADACIAQIRHGAQASAAHAGASQTIHAAGFAKYVVHTFGYAITAAFPPATGEQLHLSEMSPYVLKTGMLLSVCPNIFIGEERLGVRIVDNVLVTESGAEILSGVPRELIVAT